MPRYGLHDPNTARHHILVLMALVARSGDAIAISYAELEAVAARGVELEFHHDLTGREIRIDLITPPSAPPALPEGTTA